MIVSPPWQGFRQVHGPWQRRITEEVTKGWLRKVNPVGGLYLNHVLLCILLCKLRAIMGLQIIPYCVFFLFVHAGFHLRPRNLRQARDDSVNLGVNVSILWVMT